ncbi:hypothetical protein A3H11_01140 [Candidatus Uhrbacteria bacterium RIFCSPLOWO2_12_FULL_47_10]|nr:MAG: hypothetical protein A3H11_01140 [Candidatus Uhrbacteria bacterium RIFCSPLOWO2_12_FULL_47_10]
MIVSALIFLLFEVVYQKPRWIFGVSISIPLISFAAIYYIMGPRLKTPSARFKFLIIPTLLGFSALAFSLLIESALARHLLALLIFIGLALFFESVITYIWRHDAYVGYSLENLSSYALTLTMFLISCVLAGFYILLDLNLGLIVGLGLLAFLAINYEFFWMSKILSLPTLLFAGTLTLILTQIFVALILLPFHFMIDGAIITVLWYTAASISRAHLLGMLKPKMIYRYLALASILLLLLFASASI